MPFYQKLLLAGSAGAVGGVFGTPGDLINVRMQNDIKLPPQQRRKLVIIFHLCGLVKCCVCLLICGFFSLFSYKHALDGLIRVSREEGVMKLFNGCSTATGRAALMTIGQLSFYDQIKQYLLQSGKFDDNLVTHFTASLSAVSIHL